MVGTTCGHSDKPRRLEIGDKDSVDVAVLCDSLYEVHALVSQRSQHVGHVPRLHAFTADRFCQTTCQIMRTLQLYILLFSCLQKVT